MTKRPILPSDLHIIRSAYRRDMVNQRHQELRSNAENVKTSLKQVDRNQLTDWDLETLRMVDDILMDEKVLKLRREIKALMKSAGKKFQII
jgi:hypothetical protein